MSDTPSGQGNKTSHSQFNIAVMYESYRYLPSQRLLLFDPSIVISVEFLNFYFTVLTAACVYVSVSVCVTYFNGGWLFFSPSSLSNSLKLKKREREKDRERERIQSFKSGRVSGSD